MNKTVRKYARMYRGAIRRRGLPDVAEKTRAYEQKLTELYASEMFRKHNIYPSVQVPKVYAVVAMCLLLRSYGLRDEEIFDTVNDAFRVLRTLLYTLEQVIDLFPIAWTVAKKWNLADHDSRIKDSSIKFDYFDVTDDRVSYRISACKYVEIFEYYGIRGLCEIFCMTDTAAYAHLTRHVRFVRHSDLASGECCHDEVFRR